jgi:hypothetical protein
MKPYQSSLYPTFEFFEMADAAVLQQLAPPERKTPAPWRVDRK